MPSSPFVRHLGIRLLEVTDGAAVLRLPFRDEVVTIGTTVHGGAIATLIDTAAMTAAWGGAPVPENLRGTTVALNVAYMTAANATSLTARATVLRRGKSLSTVDVTVFDEAGEQVAKGLVTYKIG